jgi:phage-related tail fiber protein
MSAAVTEITNSNNIDSRASRGVKEAPSIRTDQVNNQSPQSDLEGILDELSTTDTSSWESLVQQLDCALTAMLDEETRSVDGKTDLTREQRQFIYKLSTTVSNVRKQLMERLSTKAIQAIARFQNRYEGILAYCFWIHGHVFKALTEKDQHAVVKENPKILIDIPASHVHSDDVYWSAIESNPRMMLFVPSQSRTEEMRTYATSRKTVLVLSLPLEERTVDMEEAALEYVRKNQHYYLINADFSPRHRFDTTLRDRSGRVFYVVSKSTQGEIMMDYINPIQYR